MASNHESMQATSEEEWKRIQEASALLDRQRAEFETRQAQARNGQQSCVPTQMLQDGMTVSENARLDVDSPSGGDDDLETWDKSGCMLRSDGDDPLTNSKWGAQGWCSRISITVILILIVLVVLLPLLDHAGDKHFSDSTNSANDSGLTCMDSCKISLVESIPIGLVYPNDSVSHPSTYDSWMKLIASAQSSIEIATHHSFLRREEMYPDDDRAKEGEDVFEALLEAGRDRGVRLRIAANIPAPWPLRNDSACLSQNANAEVRYLDFPSLLGDGMLHTKLWLIDRTHVYVGSANMYWHSLTVYKELGLLATNCSCLATDLAKIFDVYWKLAEDRKVPAAWPDSLATKINVDNPMNFTLEGNKYRAYVAVRDDDNYFFSLCQAANGFTKSKGFIYAESPNKEKLNDFSPSELASAS